MKVSNKWWFVSAGALMFLTPFVMAGAWNYARAEPYRKAAASLPAELRAAKQEGLPLMPADLERPIPVKDEQNAAPLYAALITSTAGIKDDQNTIDVAAGRATEAQKRSTRRLLASAASQLRLVEKAAALSGCDFHRDWSIGPSLLFPEYAPIRKMARLLAARAALESEAGHPEQALRTIGMGERIARHVGKDPIAIAMLVRIAIEAMMDRPFRLLIKKYADRPEILRLALQTDREFRDLPDVRYGMTGESVLCQIMAASIRQDKSKEEIFTTAVKTGASQEVASDAYEARSLSFWRRTFAALKQTAGREPMAVYVAAKAVNEAEEAMSTTPDGKSRPTYEQDAMFSPYFSEAAGKVVEIEARQRLRRTLIALLQYRSSHGRCPDVLSQLSPSAPSDPFNGQPLRYHVMKGGFLLYSVGKNLADDGGTETPKVKGEPAPDIVAAFP